MQSFIELSDVGKVRVASPDQRPPEQLEGGLVRVEELSPVVVINFVNIHNHQGEADVDNDEDEEEDKDVHHHVAHGDDDRSYLSVHQPDLERKGKPDVRECHTKSFSCSPRIPPKNVITLNVRYFLRRASAPKQDETGNCCLCLLQSYSM